MNWTARDKDSDRFRFDEWRRDLPPLFPGGYCGCSCGPEHHVLDNHEEHHFSIRCRCHRVTCWRAMKPCASASPDWRVYARMDEAATRWLEGELVAQAEDNLNRWQQTVNWLEQRR